VKLVPPEPVDAAFSPVAGDDRWQRSAYVVEEKRFTLGRQYRVRDDLGRVVAFCKQKSFKLKEDIRFWTDESRSHELFRLQATKVLDWNGNFVVEDSQTNQVLGFLRRKGWKSMVRDEWHIFDAQERPWGVLQEDSAGMAVVRRAVGLLDVGFFEVPGPPYKYYLFRGSPQTGPKVGEIKERFQVFGDTYDLHVDPAVEIDRRVLIGLTVSVDAIEGE
jgi:uncharacterized protein YxjI